MGKKPTLRTVDSLPGVAPWIGGKRNLARALIERIDAVPHTCYAEPFIGMAGVFLRRRRVPACEVINDLSGDVANLFRILQRHHDAFIDALRFSVTSRREFKRLTAVDPAGLTDIERAARFYYLQRVAYAGKPVGQAFGRSALRPGRFNVLRLRHTLEALHRRLAGVTIEELSYQDLILRYDRPTTLFYLDPPYWGCENYYGTGLFERADFERLAVILGKLKGRFILSLNDLPEVRRIFAAFTIETVKVTYRARGIKRVTELIVSGGGP